MIIEISNDIDRYKENVVLGLTARQLIYSIGALGTGLATVLLLHSHIGLNAAAFLAVLIVAPIGIGGFYNYNGMTIYEVIRRKSYFMTKNRVLTYESTENPKTMKKETKKGGGLLENIVKSLIDTKEKRSSDV